jgi:hypothetical protein
MPIHKKNPSLIIREIPVYISSGCKRLSSQGSCKRRLRAMLGVSDNKNKSIRKK